MTKIRLATAVTKMLEAAGTDFCFGSKWRLAEMKLKLDQARVLLYSAAANTDVDLPSVLGENFSQRG